MHRSIGLALALLGLTPSIGVATVNTTYCYYAGALCDVASASLCVEHQAQWPQAERCGTGIVQVRPPSSIPISYGAPRSQPTEL